MSEESAGRRAVLFDMDGVLVDSTATHVRAWRGFLEDAGLEPPPDGIRSLFGRRAIEAVADLLGVAPGDERARSALADLEGRADAEFARVPAQQLLVDGVPWLLETLRRAGWRLAVVTSARRGVAERALAPVRTLVDAVVTADDVTAGKPAPEPYLTAAAEVGVAPGRCVVVEDAVAGVLAGRRAGMRVLALETTAPGERLLEAGADLLLGHVTEVAATLGADGTGAQRRSSGSSSK